MALLKELPVVANVSAAERVDATSCKFALTTTESSTVTFDSSIDGENFAEIPDISLTVDGYFEQNLTDVVPGQYLRAKAVGTLTKCKILF